VRPPRLLGAHGAGEHRRLHSPHDALVNTTHRRASSILPSSKKCCVESVCCKSMFQLL
jgi:hypothetical protein